MKTLYEKHNLIFTNIYLFIWSMFIFLNIIELLQLTDAYNMNLYYSFADMISKLSISLLIDDCIDKKIRQQNNMDLQSVQFMSYMITHINKYEKVVHLVFNNSFFYWL